MALNRSSLLSSHNQAAAKAFAAEVDKAILDVMKGWVIIDDPLADPGPAPWNRPDFGAPPKPFQPATQFNPHQTGFITFPEEAYQDDLLNGILITPPQHIDVHTNTSTALASHPDMRILADDEDIPSYSLTWENGSKVFKEIDNG